MESIQKNGKIFNRGIDFALQIVYNNFNNHKTMFCGQNLPVKHGEEVMTEEIIQAITEAEAQAAEIRRTAQAQAAAIIAEAEACQLCKDALKGLSPQGPFRMMPSQYQ